MNVLGFVFSILTLLSIGAACFFEKQVGGRRVTTSYLGHISAGKEILNQCQSEFYASLKTPPSSKGSHSPSESRDKRAAKKKAAVLPPVNPHCARLNLYPLIEKSKEDEPFLYESAAKVLRSFYWEDLFGKEARAEYRFLDAFLLAARKESLKERLVVLEKIAFEEEKLQSLYYRMLKGTKRCDLFKKEGFPSFLDYFKVEKEPQKICLAHAHPYLLSVFFTQKGAMSLFESLHSEKPAAHSKETIERICLEAHVPLPEEEIFDLFEIQLKRHGKDPKATFIGVDKSTEISLRKVISLGQREN